MPWAIIRNLKFKKTVNHTHRGHESQRRIFREPTDRLGRSRVRRPPRRQRVQRAGGDNGRGKKHDGERPPCAQESRRSRVATDDAALRPLADFFRCRGRRHRWRVVKVDRFLAIRRVRPRRETISRAPRRTRTTRDGRQTLPTRSFIREKSRVVVSHVVGPAWVSPCVWTRRPPRGFGLSRREVSAVLLLLRLHFILFLSPYTSFHNRAPLIGRVRTDSSDNGRSFVC